MSIRIKCFHKRAWYRKIEKSRKNCTPFNLVFDKLFCGRCQQKEPFERKTKQKMKNREGKIFKIFFFRGMFDYFFPILPHMQWHGRWHFHHCCFDNQKKIRRQHSLVSIFLFYIHLNGIILQKKFWWFAIAVVALIVLWQTFVIYLMLNMKKMRAYTSIIQSHRKCNLRIQRGFLVLLRRKKTWNSRRHIMVYLCRVFVFNMKLDKLILEEKNQYFTFPTRKT